MFLLTYALRNLCNVSGNILLNIGLVWFGFMAYQPL